MWIRRRAKVWGARWVPRLLMLLEAGKALVKLLAREAVRSRLCIEVDGQPQESAVKQWHREQVAGFALAERTSCGVCTHYLRRCADM